MKAIKLGETAGIYRFTLEQKHYGYVYINTNIYDFGVPKSIINLHLYASRTNQNPGPDSFEQDDLGNHYYKPLNCRAEEYHVEFPKNKESDEQWYFSIYALCETVKECDQTEMNFGVRFWEQSQSLSSQESTIIFFAVVFPLVFAGCCLIAVLLILFIFSYPTLKKAISRSEYNAF